MKRPLWGLILVYLNCNIGLPNGGALNLLPPWIGFWLLFRGAGRLAQKESPLFEKTRVWSIVLGIYSLAMWLMTLLGAAPGGLVGWVLSMAVIVVQLYLLWLFLVAIDDMEQRRKVDLGGKRLRKGWVAMAICSVAVCLTFQFSIIAVPVLLANIIATVVYLVFFFQTSTAYGLMTMTD